MEYSNFSLSRLKKAIGSCRVVFAKNERVFSNNIVEDVIIDNTSLESFNFRELRQKLTSLIIYLKKQEKIINDAKSDAYTIDTLLANVNNKGLTDSQFRELVRTLEFNQKIKEEE